jgi:Flp pilus assembly pilin Flp
MKSMKNYVRRAQDQLLADKERGASALEWALIAAVVVVAAALIGAAVFNVIQTRAAQVQQCGNVAAGGTC